MYIVTDKRIIDINFQLGVSALRDFDVCPGDEAVYTCTLQAQSHLWRIDPFDITIIVTNPMNPLRRGDFTFKVQSFVGNILVSVVSVVISLRHNRTEISCRNRDLQDAQSTTIMVAGKLWYDYCTTDTQTIIQVLPPSLPPPSLSESLVPFFNLAQ